MLTTTEKKPKIKLPSLSAVKKALYADWTLRVKRRDGWKCLGCGCTDRSLSAHHWFVSDHLSHAARYCIHNGATLCYACHIRRIHQNPDWTSIKPIYDAVSQTPGFDGDCITILAGTELTTEMLRRLWDDMRARPVLLDDCDASVDVRGKKLFLSVDSDRPVAVVGNTVMAPGFGLCEVAVVSPDGESGRFRYTLRRLQT